MTCTEGRGGHGGRGWGGWQRTRGDAPSLARASEAFHTAETALLRASDGVTRCCAAERPAEQ